MYWPWYWTPWILQPSQLSAANSPTCNSAIWNMLFWWVRNHHRYRKIPMIVIGLLEILSASWCQQYILFANGPCKLIAQAERLLLRRLSLGSSAKLPYNVSSLTDLASVSLKRWPGKLVARCNVGSDAQVKWGWFIQIQTLTAMWARARGIVLWNPPVNPILRCEPSTAVALLGLWGW